MIGIAIIPVTAGEGIGMADGALVMSVYMYQYYGLPAE